MSLCSASAEQTGWLQHSVGASAPVSGLVIEQTLQVVTLDGIEVVPPQDEYAMKQGVTQHPITVALCVGDWIKQWRAYTGGLLQTPGMSCL